MRSVATSTDPQGALSDTGVASVAFAHDGYTPGPVPAKTTSLTEVTLSAWTRTLHSCRELWRPTVVIKRCKQTHVMQRKVADVGKSWTELVLLVRILFSGGERQELGGSILIDLGSEVLALAPESFFRGCTLETARRPLRITVANGVRISGATRGGGRPQCADLRLSGSAGSGSVRKGVCVQGRCAGILNCRLILLRGLWPHGGSHAGSVG